jgi:hypothetical protein
MTSLRSPFTVYPFDIFFKPKYDFGGWLSLYKRANQNFYIRKVSGTIPANLGCIEPLKQRDKENIYHKGVIYRVVSGQLRTTNHKLLNG